MRDILFKNLTSLDHHRRDIFLSEQFIQQGVTTKTEKHFIYSVRDHAYLNSPGKLEAWITLLFIMLVTVFVDFVQIIFLFSKPQSWK